MRPDSLLYQAMSGQPGLSPCLVRAVTWPLSLGYGAAIRRRNRVYDSGRNVERVGVPVVSVGNITAGGTGKTPLVIAVARALCGLGEHVAMVSRGYGSAGGDNDEAQLIRARVPGVEVICRPDRVAGARLAIEQRGATFIVADDAFQHRRLYRDLDIVTIDATQPFGHGHLLPRGLLREPLQGLGRADLVVLTRVDQVARGEVDSIKTQIARFNARSPILESCHRPVGLVDLEGCPQNCSLSDFKSIHLVAGIGHPQAFLRSVQKVYTGELDFSWFPDHHRYTSDDVKSLIAECLDFGFECVVTTEKDAVKLRHLVPASAPVPFLAVRIDLDFLDGGGRILDDCLAKCIKNRPAP